MVQSTDLGFGEHNLIDDGEKDRFPIRRISVGMGGGGEGGIRKARAKIIFTFVKNKICLPYANDNGCRVILL
jgi:hypothetical protein